MPLAMPESPMPDWAQPHARPAGRGPVALKPCGLKTPSRPRRSAPGHSRQYYLTCGFSENGGLRQIVPVE